jgi:hypothetical protein
VYAYSMSILCVFYAYSMRISSCLGDINPICIPESPLGVSISLRITWDGCAYCRPVVERMSIPLRITWDGGVGDHDWN